MLTLTEIMPAIRQLPTNDKLKLIRLIAEDLESSENHLNLEPGETYILPTPYNSWGAARILADALAKKPPLGQGNYTEEREELFGSLSLEEIAAEIEQRQTP